MHLGNEACLIHCLFVVGDNSGKVAIWNMEPVREEKHEKDENIPKLLCQMDNHLGKFGYLVANWELTGMKIKSSYTK